MSLETETTAAASSPTEEQAPLPKMWPLALLISLGWLGTNLGLAVADLPLRFMLKDNLHLTPQAISGFFAIGAFTNYIKPVAGVLTDTVPLFGTRRRHYLLLSLLGTGLFFILLSLVPRTYPSMLVTYAFLYLTVVFTSTTLGGVMVEVGMKYGAAGRLTAQRIAMFRLGSLLGGPLGGALAYYPFGIAMGTASFLHLILVPLFYVALPEAPTARLDRHIWEEFLAQLKILIKSKTLLSAAGMICLIAASPGFGIPLFFHQTDTLKFTKGFIGILVLVSAATGLVATMFYYAACKKLNLRTLVAASIVIHALGTLFYLGYHSQTSALIITGLSGVTGTLAMLPVYDLAARATPRGSEALGYSVMMSVWNLTNAFSDVSGSWLFGRFHWTFLHLVWLNAGTTALVLIVVPFLPAALMMRRDGATAEQTDEQLVAVRRG